MLPVRYYTLAEANAALPRVSSLIFSLRKCRGRLVAAQAELATIDEHARNNGGGKRAQNLMLELEQATNRFQRDYDSLHQMGVELRDLDQGLVDFPALRNDHLIYLCWVFGELEIGYWHEVETGFAGRQPV